MHDETNYSKNSAYKANSDGTYENPDNLILRDTDGDGVPGPIDCIKTRGISIKQNWLGETIHLQNIKTQTFEIFFMNPSVKGLERWLTKLNNLVTDIPVGFGEVGLWHDEIDLYGIKIPNCRITKVDAPTSKDRNQDAIGRGHISLTIEQRECGDLGDLDNYNPATGIGRVRNIEPPCYECTINGSGNGDYVWSPLTELDPQTKAVEECVTILCSAPDCGGAVIGAIQTRDVNCQGDASWVAAAEPTNDYEGLSGFLQEACPYIDTISEDFKFNYGKGNNISFTHSINIKLFDSCPKGVDVARSGWEVSKTGGVPGPGDAGGKWHDTDGDGTIDKFLGVPVDVGGFTDPNLAGFGEYAGNDGIDDMLTVCRVGQYNVDDALKLARQFLDTNIPNFGIAFHPGALRNLDDPKDDGGSERVIPYYTETQNLITGEVSMTKKLDILKLRDDNLNWSADYNHSLTIDQGGIATVTEKGKIIGYKKQPFALAAPPTLPENVSDKAYENARDGLGEVIGDNFEKARDRCVEFWEAHREFFKNYFDDAAVPAGDEPPREDADYGLVKPVGAPDHTGASDLKVEHPMTRTRSFNELSRECSYTISFSTAPNIFSNFMANRTYNASRGEFGSIKITEKSEITSYVPKGEDQKKIEGVCNGFAATTEKTCVAGGGVWEPSGVIGDEKDGTPDNPITIIFPQDYKGDVAAGGTNLGAEGRVFDFYNDLLADTIDFNAPTYIDPNTGADCVKPLKLWSRNVTWSPSGRNMSYSIEYTTDKTVSCLYPDPHGIRKTEVSTDDKLPKRMYKEHPIVNWKMLVHDPKQTKLGSRTVNLNVTLERIPKHNMLKDPLLPEVALKELVERAKAEILKVFDDHEELVADDMYVKLCKYTFGSKWDATLTVAVDYIQKK